MAEISNSNQSLVSGRKPGYIQISPAREGPWTTVRLNYAAPTACWRLGSGVVASEVNVRDGNRYINIRSLVSVRNNTDSVLDLRLVPNMLNESMGKLEGTGTENVQTEEFFESEVYMPSCGWVSFSGQPDENHDDKKHQVLF